MLRNIYEANIELDNIITTRNMDALDLKAAQNYSIQAVIDVNTPAAKNFATTDVTVLANTITEVAHGYTTGLKGQFSTTTTLPAGLSLITDYFIVVVDADTYKVSDTLAHALAGTNIIDITDQGTGTHTFTPTAIAGASVTHQKSNDGTNWTNIASATSITADAVVWFTDSAPTYRYARLVYTLTAGRMSTDNYVFGKGEEL
jgi:hypothetical protein